MFASITVNFISLKVLGSCRAPVADTNFPKSQFALESLDLNIVNEYHQLFPVT